MVVESITLSAFNFPYPFLVNILFSSDMLPLVFCAGLVLLFVLSLELVLLISFWISFIILSHDFPY